MKVTVESAPPVVRPPDTYLLELTYGELSAFRAIACRGSRVHEIVNTGWADSARRLVGSDGDPSRIRNVLTELWWELGPIFLKK